MCYMYRERRPLGGLVGRCYRSQGFPGFGVWQSTLGGGEERGPEDGGEGLVFEYGRGQLGGRMVQAEWVVVNVS